MPDIKKSISDLFHWRTLTRSMEQMPKVPMMLQDLIFRERNTNSVDVIDVDILVGGVHTVPFVTPIEGGTVVDKLKQQSKTVKTPRLRPKKPFTAHDLLNNRMPGQNFYVQGGGDVMSAMQQRIAKEQLDLRRRVDATIEHLCAQALTGTITVSQDNLSFEVDYGVPEAHSITLEAGDKWNEEGVSGQKILDNLQAWADLIEAETGAPPNILILGKTVASTLRAKIAADSWMDYRRINAGELSWNVGNAYMGNLIGIDVYRYAGSVTHSGSSTALVGDDKAILINANVRISIEFGLIVDLKAGASIQSEFFSKSWEEEDPSARWILAESRPLPVLWQPGCLVYADVL